MQCGACCAGEAGDIKVAPFDRQRFDGEVAPEDEEGTPAEAAPPAPPQAGGPVDIFASGGLAVEPAAEAEPLPPPPETAQQETSKESEPEPAPKADTAFLVTLNLTRGKSAGIGLDLSEGSFLRICKVDARGPVPDYNATADPEAVVRVGDFIVAVNAVKGSAREMMMALHTSGTVELDCRRPKDITLPVLDKAGGSLGLDLSYHPRSASLVVKQVLASGVIPDWNKTAVGSMQVKEDDHITAVNGKSGSPKELHEAIKNGEKLQLVVSRPASR